MSNPAVCFLSSTVINNVYFGIEDNLGESIHLHYGQFRISLTIEEFMLFAEEVEKSVKKLLNLKGVNIENVDKESLKSEWTSNYKKIQRISECNLALDKLFMKESYVDCRRIKRIIPLRESGYIKLLKGESSDVAYYEDSGLYEPSRKEKVEIIRDIIKSNGYPFLEKKILVDQDGYILDGIKRASCLYYLYGGEIEVPVIQLEIQWGKSIMERMEAAEDEIKVFLMEVKSVDASEQIDKVSYKYCYLNVLNYIKETEIPFYIVKRNRKTKEGYKICADVIVEKGRLGEFKEKMLLEECHVNPYRDYKFLYSMKMPLVFDTIDGYVLIYEQICVKSKFYKQILPIENYFAKWLWNNTKLDDDYDCLILNENANTLVRILDCMLEKEVFGQEDCQFIKKNGEFLKTEEAFNLLEKEFYSYTKILLNHLQNENYEDVLREYVSYAKY